MHPPLCVWAEGESGGHGDVVVSIVSTLFVLPSTGIGTGNVLHAVSSLLTQSGVVVLVGAWLVPVVGLFVVDISVVDISVVSIEVVVVVLVSFEPEENISKLFSKGLMII